MYFIDSFKPDEIFVFESKEEGKDGVESVAHMCNFISELYCVQRGGVGWERTTRTTGPPEYAIKKEFLATN